MTEVAFERRDIVTAASELGVQVPSNVGDLIYSFRYRADLPQRIAETATDGEAWIIRPAGRSLYRLVKVPYARIEPNQLLLSTKVPDSTPGIVSKYAFNDEQALLAKVRYNRLVDIFTGTTCYSLQNHLRTTVPRLGQVETDEIYVGLDRRGVHYVFPIQAKGGSDKLSIVQIEQDIAVCDQKFPDLVCRALAAQFMADNVIVLFEFASSGTRVGLVAEKHYLLVPPDQITKVDLEGYLQVAE